MKGAVPRDAVEITDVGRNEEIWTEIGDSEADGSARFRFVDIESSYP